MKLQYNACSLSTNLIAIEIFNPHEWMMTGNNNNNNVVASKSSRALWDGIVDGLVN